MATIVVTNYNYERFLAEAVESALNQTLACRVIVVDDGSTDGSDAVLTDLETRFPELTVIRNRNGGQASAMNAGWQQTSTPYVLFLDADDRLVPDAVEVIVDRFQSDLDADRCLFRLSWIDGRGTTIPGGFPDEGQPLPGGDLRTRVLSNPDDIPWQPTSGNAFRSAGIARFMPIPEPPYRISADHYLSNLSALTGPIATVERALGQYRVHGTNADHRDGFDLERARSILERTDVTRSELISYGRALGLTTPDGPDGFVSLTNSAMRLTSFRAGKVGQSSHAYEDDKLMPLITTGLRAALARKDLPVVRRAIAMAWIVALGFAPRALVQAVAAKGLTR